MIDTEPGQNARLEVEIQAFYSKTWRCRP